MKKRINIILTILLCMMCWNGAVWGSEVILGPVSSPDTEPSSPEYVRVVVTRPSSSNEYGGSFTIYSSEGYGNITSSVLYPVVYYFVKKGVYRIDNLSTSCTRVMCNGVEIKEGSVVNFTGGGYVAFQMN